MQTAQDYGQQHADEIRESSAEEHDEAADGWKAVKDNWHSHVQKVHESVADRQAAHDLHAAERDADPAEQYAVDVVAFALAALDEAEYAVLDAILARADADALEASS